MRFTKLTEAEQAEFMELIKDSFDPELYTEDELPMLRANKKKVEEEHRRGEGRQTAGQGGYGPRPEKGRLKLKDLSKDHLMALAQETYDKEQWSADDVDTLRACWEEFERRGHGQPVIFFRPTYFDVLKFHEVDSGEVGEERVQMYERTGAEVAPDYRDIMGKLRGVEVILYEKPQDLPEYEDAEALEELMRIVPQEDQNDLPGR